VNADVIELRNRKIYLVLPARAAVFAAPESAIVACINDVAIVGVDPNVMKVAMRAAGDGAETLPAIHAQKKRRVGLEDFVFVLGIDDQVAEIKRPPDKKAAGIEARPIFSAVIRAVQGAVLGFDVGVNDIRLQGRNGERYASPGLRRQALAVLSGEVSPVLASVGGLIKTASWPAGAERPALTTEIPQ